MTGGASQEVSLKRSDCVAGSQAQAQHVAEGPPTVPTGWLVASPLSVPPLSGVRVMMP